MRMIKPRSNAIIICILTSIILFIMKILAIGIIVNLSWWLIVLPLLLVILGIVVYVAIYILKIWYKNRKYKRNNRLKLKQKQYEKK